VFNHKLSSTAGERMAKGKKLKGANANVKTAPAKSAVISPK